MPGMMRLCLAVSTIALASFAMPARAGDVHGEVSGSIGSDGSRSVSGTLIIGSDAHPDDDPAPPMTVPTTPGTTGPSGAGMSHPVIPDATTDGAPPNGDGPSHN
jgi:hypothetical protein